MSDPTHQLRIVLGDQRILLEHDGNPRQRVTAVGAGGRVVGAAVLEPLYGSAAEVALAVDDPDDHTVVHQVLEHLRSHARELGLTTLRFTLTPPQRALAAVLDGGPGAVDVLTLRL